MKFSFQEIERIFVKMIENPTQTVIIVLVILLIGIIFLWLRGFLGEKGKQTALRKKNQRIRDDFIFEINKNLKLLKDFWDKYQINFPSSEQSLTIEQALKDTQQIFDGSSTPKTIHIEHKIDLPRFCSEILKKYRILNFQTEDEAKNIRHFYNKLDNAISMYKDLKKLGESDDDIVYRFELREQLEAIVTEVLEQGNPLKNP